MTYRILRKTTVTATLGSVRVRAQVFCLWPEIKGLFLPVRHPDPDLMNSTMRVLINCWTMNCQQRAIRITFVGQYKFIGRDYRLGGRDVVWKWRVGHVPRSYVLLINVGVECLPNVGPSTSC